MILLRNTVNQHGVFGTLHFDDDTEVCKTLEHAYPSGKEGFKPKIPPGRYICEKGFHQLSNGVPFETYEILGVRGHWGLIFHVGNYNHDSDGCVLVGKSTRNNMLYHSRVAFFDLMLALRRVDRFALLVIGG